MSRIFLLFLLIAPLTALSADQPNVLFICIDDLRAVLGPYGGRAITPNIDRLAETAAVFTRHYVQYPVCGPSRSSLMSGLRPDSTKVYGNRGTGRIARQPDKPTLPAHFRNNGYTTLSFGKTYHGLCAEPGCGWSDQPWRPPSGWAAYVEFPFRGFVSGDASAWRPAYEIYDGPDRLHNDFQTADKTIQALEDNRDGPFFIAAGFYKPHLPFVAPQRFWDLYDGVDLSIENLGIPQGAGDFAYSYSEIWSYGVEKDVLFSMDLPPNEQQERHMVRAYFAAVSFIDAQVGRILDRLDDLGLADNTAVVLWGDHGFHLGDHGRWAKHTQFENNMRSPLMVRFPGRQEVTGETRALVETVDIYPTLCDFAAIGEPKHLEGASFLPVVSGAVERIKRAAYSQIVPVRQSSLMGYSVRTQDYRYIEWREREDSSTVILRELYDHRKDPNEHRSVAGDLSYATEIERHARLVRQGYTSLED